MNRISTIGIFLLLNGCAPARTVQLSPIPAFNEAVRCVDLTMAAANYRTTSRHIEKDNSVSHLFRNETAASMQVEVFGRMDGPITVVATILDRTNDRRARQFALHVQDFCTPSE